MLVIWLRLPSIASVPAAGPPPPSRRMQTDAVRCGDTFRHEYRPLDDVSPVLACAVVAAEDHRYFRHDGVDWKALRLAAWHTLVSLRAGPGAGTIAMQLARNQFLTPARTTKRKVQEIFLARQLVDALGRRRVLELYLNVAEWGPCVYGAQEGARALFGRDAGDLDLFEATLLAAILPRPRRPLVPDDARRIAMTQGMLIRTFRDTLITREEAKRELEELDRTWRQLVRTAGADELAAALRARSAARAPVDPTFGDGWLELRCGLP